MIKEISRKSYGLIILVIILSLCTLFFNMNPCNETTTAEGAAPYDARARIGFESVNSSYNEFYLEENNGELTVRVYVSQVQSVDIPFTLTETRFGVGGALFVFANGYTLPAGSSYVDVTFNQVAQAESGNGVRLSDIYIHCNTATVTVGDVEYYGENEPYDNDFLAVVMDKDGGAELIIEGLPHLSYETDGDISSSFVRSGSVSSGAEVYYRIKDYNPNNTKELVFDNYNSVLSFEANERNKTLKLEFFDNDRLNLREAYKLEIYSFQGISRIFDLSQRRYLEENEDAVLDFAIMDDELFSEKFIARVQYYQPGDTNPTYQISEGSPIFHNVIFDGLRNNPLPSFRLYYTVEVSSTAEYGVDYVIGGNYSQHTNLGYIEVPFGGEQYFGNIIINTIDDAIFNGTRTVVVKFFVNGRNDILLQPLDTITFEIIDNERLPDNNTVSWASIGSLNGCGWYEDNILRINNNFYDWDGYIIGIDTDYLGTAPLNIPVRFEDITVKNGIDYIQESMYALLQYRPDIGTNKYGIDLNLINDFYFAGTRRLKVTILEEGLTQGLTVTGETELLIDLVGRIEAGYNYIQYSQGEINSIFSVGKNETLTFDIKRTETEAFSTFLDLSRNQQGFFLEGTHIASGIFPYEVVWAENETKKTITFEFLQGWDDSTPAAAGLITCLGSNMQPFNDTYGENQYTSVPITLYQSNSAAHYYFQGNEMVTGLTREYKYSSGELLIEVKRILLSAQSFDSSVDYNLTFDYDITKTWQIITSQHAAEIGTHINSLSGTLYFQGDETTKFIRVTVPDIINMPYGSKFVNIYLHNPSEKTYILRNWDWDGKFDTAKIKITNDITPVLEYSDLTTSTIEEGGYETTVINALEYERKEYDSFRLELIPYETDETPYHTKLYYSMEMYLYSGYDLSAAGIEVFVNGLKVECIQTAPYIYNYSDGGGSHSITYNYAYVVNVLVNKENPFVSFTLKYSEIADKGLEFLTTSLLIKSHNQYFMNGWETYEKLLLLNACSEDAEVDIEMRSSSVASEGETNVQAGDIVYLTLTRSSTDPGASTMFFRSIAYGVKSFPASPDAIYYFEPLNAFVVFEPYERTKTVAFVTRDNRPQGIGWDSVASAAHIKLYNYYNTSEILDELIVNVREDWPVTLINADVILLTNYVQIHKGVVDDYEGITVKFIFDKTYDTDIEFSISGLDGRIGNLTLILPMGETEINHTFTLNEAAFYSNSETLSIDMSGILITVFQGAELKLAVPEGLNVIVFSRLISSQKFYAGVPSALSIDEDDKGYISLDIFANRSIYPSTWKDVIAYVSLGGTAVYGTDYFIRYDGKGGENIFDLSTGIVVIWKLHEKSTLKIYPIDNTIIDGEKTIIVTVLDYHFGYVAYPETFSITINDNEYFGDVFINKSQTMSLGGQTTVTLFRENYTLSDLIFDFEIEEIYGVYGVDYAISRMFAPGLARSGVLTFYGDASSIVLYVNPLTEIGETAVFYFRIPSEGDDYFSIKTSEVFVSLRSIYDGGEFVARTVKTDSELNKWPGNYGDYLLDYTKYYSSYSAGAKVKITSQNFAGVTEDIYMDFNPNGLTYISASGRSGEYIVPSGISLNHWYDINGDGIKELIFVANLDSCFGGIAELNRMALRGIYALDLVSGDYTLIFAVDPNMVTRHLDIYINDLKGDGFPDAVVLSTPWADSLLRRNGGNILYIIDNTNGVFSVENVYDGNAVINGTNMTLYSVFVSGSYKGYDRTIIEVSYYSRTVGVRTAYGAVIELSAGENSRFIYCEGANYGIEGSNFVLTVYNVTGAAGTATMVFSSENAVYGRDYLPQSLTITFAEGELVRNITLLTLNNNIPTDNLIIYFYLESNDFNVGRKFYDLYVHVIDSSVVNKGVAYTVHQGFDSSYTSSEYITGDSAAFSLHPLTINGIRCGAINNDLYDVRFSVRFGNSVWTDEDMDGFISITGLRDIYLSSENLHYIFIDVEFLHEGTNTAFSRKTFSAWYYYYETQSNYYKVLNDVEITETIYMGKLQIFAESMISCRYSQILGRFSLSFTNSIDNKTYTFYSDNRGYLNAQIDFGIVQGMFNYSYILTPLSVPAEAFSSGQRTLRAYKDTMDFPVTVIDSVRQSLLRNVLIEVVGINTNFSYSGRSNAETGLFTIPALIPLKTYRITVNGDYGISYFETYTAVFTPTVDVPNLSVSLEIRTYGASLDMLTVVVIKKYNLNMELENLAYRHGYSTDYARIIRYLSGESAQLNTVDRQLLDVFLKTVYLNYSSYAGKYRIYGDLLFSNDYPGVYKSLAKNPDDITLISYRYNPDYDFGDIKVLLGREELTEENSRYLCRSVTYDKYSIGDFITDTVHFYSFTGAENCIIDVEIVSDVYLEGKKSVPLASFGTGLGSFLLNPVQNIFSSMETDPIPANFAFLNGMSFVLGFADIDFAFEYDEENMTFSLYMGASKDLYEASRGMKYGDIGRPTLAQLRAAKAAGLGMGRGQVGLGVGLGGKMIFEYVDSEWKLVAGEIYFSVNASYNYTKYILLPVVSIPAFFSATVSLEIETTIYFNWNEAEQFTEITGDLAIELAVEIECGIGIKGFLSASVYGRAGIEVIIQLESGATKLTLYVEGGVRIQIIFWKYHYSFGRAEWSTQSDGYVDREAVLASLCLSDLTNTTDYSGVALLYLSSGNLLMGIGLGDDGQAEDIIMVSNVYEKSSPKIAELADGTKMIAWINYDIERGEDNAEVINYIYFDGENWSEVTAADDTITADLDMDIKVINGRYTIICTEVKEELSSGSTISERLIKSDVAVLVFDPVSRTFIKTIMTNNLFNDRQALFDYDNGFGIAVVYRSENTNITDDMTINDFLCGENADNKLYYSIYNGVTDSWSEFILFQYTLPAVSTMSLKIVEGIAYIALECDNDDNFDTTSDREIMLLKYIFETGQSRILQLTDNNIQDVSPSLMQFKGKAFIAYRSGDDVRYWYENQSYYVCTLPQNYTNFEMFASGEYAVMLFTMSVNGISQVFASVMDGESMVFSAPAQVTFSDKPTRDPIISFSEGQVTVYYCADTYTLLSVGEEEYSFNVTSNIVKTSFNLYSELSIEVLPPDYSAMRPGEEYIFTVRIHNSGTLNVVSPWIKVYLGEILLEESIAGIVPGNGYLDFPISVTLPSERSTLRFEIGKDDLYEDSGNNSSELEVLLSDISIEENYTMTWNEDGTLTVILSITNQGFIDIENISIKVTAYSNASSLFTSSIIPLLIAGETKIINLTIEKEYVIFNANNELWLKAYALTLGKNIHTVGADDYNTLNNVRSLRTARPLFADGSTLALLTQSLDLIVGGNGFISIVYTGDGEILITSSDTSIITIDGRNVIALKSGTATLSITDGTEIRNLNVTVNALPEDPTDPEDPEDPSNPIIGNEPESPIWWVYAGSIGGGILLAGAATIIILIKKGKIVIKK